MKRAIIIGATSGIGLAVSKQLWNDGWTIGIAGRRIERLELIKQELGERVYIAQLDVTKNEASERMLSLISSLGDVDLIFLCSGIGSQNRELTEEIELNTVKTNVEGFTRMIDTAFNYFKKNGGGHIAAVSSIAGTKGLGIAAAYSATKGFQNIYIQCLSQLSSMTKSNIVFTDIRPGFVDTDLLKSGKFPMLLNVDYVAKIIVKALYRKKRVVVVDWKYKILVFFWRMIPRFIWERLNIANN